MRQTDTIKIKGREIPLYRTTNDINGNPRYVVHFLSFAPTMGEALVKIRKIGGRRYRGKKFGGGLVFSSYSVESELEFALE